MGLIAYIGRLVERGITFAAVAGMTGLLFWVWTFDRLPNHRDHRDLAEVQLMLGDARAEQMRFP